MYQEYSATLNILLEEFSVGLFQQRRNTCFNKLKSALFNVLQKALFYWAQLFKASLALRAR